MFDPQELTETGIQVDLDDQSCWPTDLDTGRREIDANERDGARQLGCRNMVRTSPQRQVW